VGGEWAFGRTFTIVSLAYLYQVPLESEDQG
jgi:hypothetical protein